ncbi:MAG: hypothetical protein WCH74_08930 [Chloroflexota bacterium]
MVAVVTDIEAAAIAVTIRRYVEAGGAEGLDAGRCPRASPTSGSPRPIIAFA